MKKLLVFFPSARVFSVSVRVTLLDFVSGKL